VGEEFTTQEGVKYVLVIIALGAIIAIASLTVSSGRLGLWAGAGVMLACYAAVYAVVRSFRMRFLS